MASTLWWKFSLEALGIPGTHRFGVKNFGTEAQQVYLDGQLLEAPPETTTFTGPGASLLELRLDGGCPELFVEGQPAERSDPSGGGLGAGATSGSPAVSWWKFTLPTSPGVHHCRVENIGTDFQMVSLDGAPLDAPPGTMQFTGPAGSLLELLFREGMWILLVDGVVLHQCGPGGDVTRLPTLSWRFNLPTTGQHVLQARSLGEAGQEVILDDMLIPVPPGELMFTGPGGALVQIEPRVGGDWALLIDGTEIRRADVIAPGEQASDGFWRWQAPGGAYHEMTSSNIGAEGQLVTIDGVLVDGPPGQTTFTGPGGVLLELRRSSTAWMLFLDGVCCSSESSANGLVRTFASQACLPQGVSLSQTAGRYIANIRLAGKFKCLGEFDTVEEAHARYLDAKGSA